MCGIVGFTGVQHALPFLLQGLSKLEYRGYDSAGVTLVDGESLETVKTKGRLSQLERMLNPEKCVQTCGIGHTRWATHGVPSNLNAHPHTNEDETIAIVHNGIVENYQTLKNDLLEKGYHFHSETDSEVIVMLIDYYHKQGCSMLESLRLTLKKLTGSWALCAVSVDEPDTIYVAKKESPMVIGHSAEGSFCASDATALLVCTRDILVLDDGDMAVLKPEGIRAYDADANEKNVQLIHYPYDISAAQKGGYDSFMMKEIHEQPDAVRETLRGKLKDGKIDLPKIDELEVDWKKINKVYFIACGTAYHACLYAEILLRRLTRVTCMCMPASEFRYSNPNVDENTICVFVSQSGETADTLAAVKLAKAMRCITISVVNVLGSSISRQTDAVIYTAAGPEISVASTKAYTTQLVLLNLLVLKMAENLGFPIWGLGRRIADLRNLPEVLSQTLQMQDTMEKLAALLKDQRDAYFIGRQLDYPTALEGALKLKEISYVHADAYYAGELKHGPIALIEKNTVVVAIATQQDVAAKTISNIEETIARGARVILITTQDMPVTGFEYIVRIPAVSEDLAPVSTAVLLQLFAYFTAKEKGRDIDKPRNLAKSVTVE